MRIRRFALPIAVAILAGFAAFTLRPAEAEALNFTLYPATEPEPKRVASVGPAYR